MESLSLSRRGLLASVAALGVAGLIPASVGAAAETGAIRPFRVNIPEEVLVDLRRRLAATRWPERETVADDSQGVPLATMQELVRYWATDYDWRKCESRLNALPDGPVDAPLADHATPSVGDDQSEFGIGREVQCSPIVTGSIKPRPSLLDSPIL